MGGPESNMALILSKRLLTPIAEQACCAEGFSRHGRLASKNHGDKVQLDAGTEGECATRPNQRLVFFVLWKDIRKLGKP